MDLVPIVVTSHYLRSIKRVASPAPQWHGWMVGYESKDGWGGGGLKNKAADVIGNKAATAAGCRCNCGGGS